MSIWIFGYGSLLFRPGFPSGPPRVALVQGWARRLYQGSPDHRGTPERLGRVATLVPASGESVWGAVFEVAADDAQQVLADLDHRERGGYVRLDVAATVRDVPGRTVRATTWIATHDNPYYLGPAADHVMLDQISSSRGPSGTNADYVLALAATLRALAVEDEHIFSLARALEKTKSSEVP